MSAERVKTMLCELMRYAEAEIDKTDCPTDLRKQLGGQMEAAETLLCFVGAETVRKFVSDTMGPHAAAIAARDEAFFRGLAASEDPTAKLLGGLPAAWDRLPPEARNKIWARVGLIVRVAGAATPE